jgi:hypothetical protein
MDYGRSTGFRLNQLLFPQFLSIETILRIMRLILLMGSLLIVSLLVIKGFPVTVDSNPVDNGQAEAIKKAKEVNQLIQDAANQQRQLLENQTQ